MPVGRTEAPHVPPVIERFVKQLIITLKAVLLYPPASSIPRENASEAADTLRQVLQRMPEVRFGVTKEALLYEGIPVFPGRAAYEAFAQELYNRNLADVRFHAGTSATDIIAFLTILKHSPSEVADAGGFEGRLWEQGVDTITVSQAFVKIVDAPEGESEAETTELPPMNSDEIDELLAAAYGGRPRDQRMLVRVMEDSSAMCSYLAETMSGRGRSPEEMLAGVRTTELAHFIAKQDPRKRPALYRSLADAVMSLEPDTRRVLLTERLLPEGRTDDAVASVVRQMDVDRLCRVLADSLEAGEIPRDGVARAIRNLAMISMSDREEVVNAAGAALLGDGFGEGDIASILEMAAPSKLEVRERAKGAIEEEQPVDTIFKLMDLAPAGSTRNLVEYDAGVEALREESRRGIADGDVIGALVTLVTIDPREEQFASMMAMVEDSLDLLLERGELEVAADAAAALRSASDNEALNAAQRARVTKALAKFANSDDMREIHRALRNFKSGTLEHDAARRLLGTLGMLALQPLLELLADEPDMSARKAMVDTLSAMAAEYVPELGEHITDSRWFFVRNVVNILGSTKRPNILYYLERTLRHNDARVRRETIRAIAGVNDRLAVEMLIAGLDDDDAQNVQLAARYLGVSDERGGVRALESVARG
ncbi:MAG: HEAT repeat domain-containing protein, partial [Actinomycetota bacterium]|nr:HEAT repeat domain-containing protein [Actinomycetota bacterium]